MGGSGCKTWASLTDVGKLAGRNCVVATGKRRTARVLEPVQREFFVVDNRARKLHVKSEVHDICFFDDVILTFQAE